MFLLLTNNDSSHTRQRAPRSVARVTRIINLIFLFIICFIWIMSCKAYTYKLDDNIVIREQLHDYYHPISPFYHFDPDWRIHEFDPPTIYPMRVK